MSKRFFNPTEDVTSGNDAYLKRQKISHPNYTQTQTQTQYQPYQNQNQNHIAASAEDIQSSRQLKQLLAFDQDAGRSKHGIQSLKTFLDSFASGEVPNRLAILKEYLQGQKPMDSESKDTVFLDDIMQTWSFASQSNNDSLLSGVAAVLALLLRTISSNIDFTEHGLLLCKTLLQKHQLELIARCLTANPGKDFVISPALRLLKEVAGFDGGAVIKQLFRAREYTFKSLGRNLGIRTKADAIEDYRRPSVRTNAVRFLLTCIRLLPAEGNEKNELCQQRDVVAGLTRPINLDPPGLIDEILKTLTTHIIQDEKLSRDAKKRMLNSVSLGRIVTLYEYDYTPKEEETPVNVVAVAHEFLTTACTTHDIGILHRQRGFYPMGVDADDRHDLEGNQSSIDLGLDNISWANKSYQDKLPVQNTILSQFIKSLRPWSNLKQSDLLLTIFRAAPELIADYFFSKKNFSFDPKLTATWMGYSASVFSAVSLPLPEFFGYRGKYANLPPPTSIVIESIIPLPVDLKSLTRCLTNKSDLIRFLGIRLLTIALKKLRRAVAMYTEAALDNSKLWDEAKERLIDEFCERCPTMKDVVSAFKNISETNLLQREAITKLLVLYYEVIPQIALDAKLDISSSLIEALELAKKEFSRREETALQAMITEHLFQIANYSPGMRWFAKVEPLKLSPFVAMLQQALSSTSDSQLLSLLQSIASENQILQSVSKPSSANALVASLNTSKTATSATFEFLDNCINRCATTPIKYFDQFEEFYLEVHGKGYEEVKKKGSPVSLLHAVILEQWPFVAKSQKDAQMQEIARFISHYLAASVKIKEDKKVLKIMAKKIVEETPKDSACRKILDKYRKLVDSIEIPEDTLPKAAEKSSKTPNIDPIEEKAQIVSSMLENSESPLEDNTALTRWISKEIEEVIEDGHTSSLTLLLSSPHLHIRKEALTNLSKLATKLKASSYEEKEQNWLLICEVVETARDQINSQPLPTPITAFASQSFAVLSNPLHCIYPKLNKFLSLGPTWTVDNLPLMQTILHDRPSLTESYTLELEWLLKYMILGLHTKEDLNIYRKRRVFEKVLSLYNDPYVRLTVKEKILRLLFKAVRVEGGSDTLITRFSGITWLKAQIALEGSGDMVKKLKVLVEELNEMSDEKRVKKWMEGGKSKSKDEDVVMG